MVSMRPSPLSLSLLKDAGPKGTLCRGTRSTGTALDQHVDSYESLGTSGAEPWAAAPRGGQDPPPASDLVTVTRQPDLGTAMSGAPRLAPDPRLFPRDFAEVSWRGKRSWGHLGGFRLSPSPLIVSR